MFQFYALSEIINGHLKRDLDTARGAETLAHAPCGKPLERGAGDDDLHLELKYPEVSEMSSLTLLSLSRCIG